MTGSEMVALGDPLFTSPKTSEVGKRQVSSAPLHKWVEWSPGLSANHPTDMKRCQCPYEIAGECVKVDNVPGIPPLIQTCACRSLEQRRIFSTLSNGHHGHLTNEFN